jgi:hypothetical protein
MTTRKYKVTYIGDDKKHVTEEITGIAAARSFALLLNQKGLLTGFTNMRGNKITL